MYEWVPIATTAFIATGYWYWNWHQSECIWNWCEIDQKYQKATWIYHNGDDRSYSELNIVKLIQKYQEDTWMYLKELGWLYSDMNVRRSVWVGCEMKDITTKLHGYITYCGCQIKWLSLVLWLLCVLDMLGFYIIFVCDVE